MTKSKVEDSHFPSSKAQHNVPATKTEAGMRTGMQVSECSSESSTDPGAAGQLTSDKGADL